MGRAISVSQLLNSKKNLLDFDGEWKRVIGCPELTGSWIIWGNSSNGKTSFTLQLVKYMCRFAKVAYNSLEEGDSESLRTAFRKGKMSEVARKLIVLDCEPIDEMSERLSKKHAPKIVVIDSLQYSGLSYNDYKKLKAAHRDKLFIFISHADGKHPDGRVGKSIRYDAMVKIRVEGYRAFVKSRYADGDEDYLTVWKEGARKYWLD